MTTVSRNAALNNPQIMFKCNRFFLLLHNWYCILTGVNSNLGGCVLDKFELGVKKDVVGLRSLCRRPKRIRHNIPTTSYFGTVSNYYSIHLFNAAIIQYFVFFLLVTELLVLAIVLLIVMRGLLETELLLVRKLSFEITERPARISSSLRAFPAIAPPV